MEIIDATSFPEFDGHVKVVACRDPATSLNGFIALHRGGVQKPAFGATRIWTYTSEQEAIRDALKLSRIMSYKSALAGLGFGGAKAVLMAPGETFDRKKYMTSYAKFLSTLPHKFMTGADVGITLPDMILLSSLSHSIVGSIVDPVKYTIDGLLVSLRIVLLKVFGTEDLSERTIAIQGLGKIGYGLLEHLAKEAKQIYVSDMDQQKIAAAQNLGPRVIPVGIDEIYTQQVDIFAPCALSNTINNQTIHTLACKVILGSANAQLEHDVIGDALYKKGILYAPDYVVNAGGLISVTSEYEYKEANKADIHKKIINIGLTLNTILNKSTHTHTPPHRIANEMAKKISDTFQ